VIGSVVSAEALEEAAGRGMEVEEADGLVVRQLEAVDGPRRGRGERARPGDARLVSDPELDLAFEHVEAVRVVAVDVRVDAFEAGTEGHLDRAQLRKVAKDPVRTRLVLERFRVGRGRENRLLERPPSVRRRVVLVETGFALAAHDVPEARRRRVDVEEDRGGIARVPERVHHVRRRGRERPRSRAHRLLLGPERELDLALEHVERVRVVVVDVRLGAFLARLVAEPRDDQGLELDEDAQRPLGPIGGRLAFAGR
jgi:hypothetical protein